MRDDGTYNGGRRPTGVRWSIHGAGIVLLVVGLVCARILFAKDGRSLGELADAGLSSLGLELSEVSLSGHNHTLEADIFAALDAGRKKSLLTFDAAAARKRIEALPWIASAQLSRELPGTLRVEVTERKPVALWLDGQRSVLVDATGRQLAAVDRRGGEGMLQVSGKGAPKVMPALRSALAMHPAIEAALALAERKGDRRWSLHLRNGAVVHLPEQGMAAALQRLADLEARSPEASARQPRLIDLRRPDMAALRAEPGVSPGAQSRPGRTM